MIFPFRSSAFIGLALIISAAPAANAVECAAGAYHAGCVGPHGAVGVPRGYGYRGAVMRPVGRPYGYGGACVWRAGVRICR
jgi:hypothetical protein